MPRPAFPPESDTTGRLDPTDASLDAVERELVAIFADLSAALGLPRSLGQIYGLAYASPAPICFDDVVQRLALSKGSASQGLRVLRELGALRAISEDGRRMADDGPRRTEHGGKKVDREVGPSPVLRPQSSGSGPARRPYFLPETSVRALLGAIMRQRIQPPLASGAARLARLRAVLPAERKTARSSTATVRPGERGADARAAHLRQRLHSLETWHQKAGAFLPLVLKLAGADRSRPEISTFK